MLNQFSVSGGNARRPQWIVEDVGGVIVTVYRVTGSQTGVHLPSFSSRTPCESVCGLYRFLGNDRVSEREILAGHFQATQARFVEVHGPVLVLHDTTEVSFTRSDKP